MLNRSRFTASSPSGLLPILYHTHRQSQEHGDFTFVFEYWVTTPFQRAARAIGAEAHDPIDLVCPLSPWVATLRDYGRSGTLRAIIPAEPARLRKTLSFALGTIQREAARQAASPFHGPRFPLGACSLNLKTHLESWRMDLYIPGPEPSFLVAAGEGRS